MELIYSSQEVESVCTSLKAAKKLFGGNAILATSLLARINAFEQAETIKDIIVQPSFHFHDLKNKNRRNLDGYFGVDVKTHKDAWRIIIQPLNQDKKPFIPCNIDEIASCVRIIEIREVSKHYE